MALEDALASTLKTYGHERLELEFRLGHHTGGRGGFVPGVSQASWETLKAALDKSTAFRVVATDTRELISGDGSGAKYVVDVTGSRQPYWTFKKRLWDIEQDTVGPWSCRASASLEVVNESPQQRPAPTSHRFERHKMRWSYRHRCWSFDLTRVASNLPHQLDNDGVSYEVEIELADATELFARPVPNLVEWARTLVADVCGMMM